MNTSQSSVENTFQTPRSPTLIQRIDLKSSLQKHGVSLRFSPLGTFRADTVLCYDNTVLCFDKPLLCLDNSVLCLEKCWLCSRNILLCFKNCLLCLQIWATVLTRYVLLFICRCAENYIDAQETDVMKILSNSSFSNLLRTLTLCNRLH